MAGLHDDDIVVWSEPQAALLRTHAATTRANDTIDWPNIIEEIESVPSEQRHAVESLLPRALIHVLKAEAWPLSPEVPHWQADARVCRAQARRRFAPFMRQRIDLPGIYSDALRGLPTVIDRQPPLPVPDACPVSLDDLPADD